MRTICIIFVLALFVGPLSPKAIAVVPESNNKPVEAVLEIYPNYVGHLLGVAQVKSSNAYSREFRKTVYRNDFRYLKKNADLLEWTDGDEGILSYFFITFPAYINLTSKEELNDYLTALNSAVVVKSFDALKEKYNESVQNLDLWNGFNNNELIFSYGDEIQELSKIWMRNYDAYYSDVWPEQRYQISAVANAINQELESLNLINKWETVTELEYQADSYQIVLSRALKNNPEMKTLGYDKLWCHYCNNSNQMIKQICEDAGLRILAGLCSEKYQDYNPNVCFKVYQTMAQYFSDQILADLGLIKQIKTPGKEESQLYGIFNVIKEINPDIEVDQLYAVALDAFAGNGLVINQK